MFTNLSAHTHQQYPDRHFGDDHQPLSSRFHKKCKTSFNFTVCNCMPHPWLLYMSSHIKPVLFSDEGIMPNKYTSYTWIFIYNLMCILSCKSGRIHAHVFICMENILTQFNFHHYHYCIHCTFVHFMFAFSVFFVISVLFFFLFPYFSLLCRSKDASEITFMLIYHRHSPLIYHNIVIVFSLSFKPIYKRCKSFFQICLYVFNLGHICFNCMQK